MSLQVQALWNKSEEQKSKHVLLKSKTNRHIMGFSIFAARLEVFYARVAVAHASSKRAKTAQKITRNASTSSTRLFDNSAKVRLTVVSHLTMMYMTSRFPTSPTMHTME